MRRKVVLPVLTAFFLLFLVVSAGAQQITRIAVLDMSRVFAYFPKDVAAIKNFETKKNEVQAEVDKRSKEITSLRDQKALALSQGNQDLANSLDSQITQKTSDLKDYAAARQNELDLLAKALSSGDSFLQRLNSSIAQVAESDGYSIVLNLKPQDTNANIVLWNSQAIDITDKVIQAISAPAQ
jgi:outer membrane protein